MLSLIASSSLGRSSPTEDNTSWSPSTGHHDSTGDVHAPMLFSKRFGEEDRSRRAGSDTFPRLRDMVSLPLQTRHSSESLPPLSLPIILQHDMGINAGISLLQNTDHVENSNSS